MNKRQIKKKVKQAKINKERGQILSLEERHFIRNYGPKYHTKKEIAGFNNFFVDLPGLVEAAVNGIRVGLADYFQNLADALRTGGREE